MNCGLKGSETSNAVLFFGFGGEVAVSVIAVSSAEGSVPAWSPMRIFAFRVQPVTDRTLRRGLGACAG